MLLVNRHNLANFVFLAIGLLFCLPGQLQGQVQGNFSVRGVKNFQVSGSRQTSMMSRFNRFSIGASNLTAGVVRSSPNPFSTNLRQSMTGPARGPSVGATAKGGGLRSGRLGMMDSMRMSNNFSSLLGSVPTAAAGSTSARQLRAIPSFRFSSSQTNAFTIKADELGKPFLRPRENSLTTGLASRKSRLSRNRLSRSRLTASLTTELTQGLTRNLTHPKTPYDVKSNLFSNQTQNRTHRSLAQRRIGFNKISDKK
jgi:hypothetical protein